MASRSRSSLDSIKANTEIKQRVRDKIGYRRRKAYANNRQANFSKVNSTIIEISGECHLSNDLGSIFPLDTAGVVNSLSCTSFSFAHGNPMVDRASGRTSPRHTANVVESRIFCRGTNMYKSEPRVSMTAGHPSGKGDNDCRGDETSQKKPLSRLHVDCPRQEAYR